MGSMYSRQIGHVPEKKIMLYHCNAIPTVAIVTMLPEVLFVLGIVCAIWFIDFCNPRGRRANRRRVRPCKADRPERPGTLYTPFPYPKDTHNSDARNRVYDVDEVRVA